MISQEQFNLFKQIISENNKKFITIDGIIGAGKTTIIELLINKYRENGIIAYPIYEPIEIWTETGVLDYFYKNIKTAGYEFQTYTFITRIQKTIEEVINNPNADIYLLERSIYTDKNIFVELLKNDLGPLKMKMYNDWWNIHSLLLPIKIDKWIVLDTSLNTSIERICKRNRSAEANIPIEYQNNLMKTHHKFINTLKNNGENVIVINKELMDDNFIENENILNNIYNIISL